MSEVRHTTLKCSYATTLSQSKLKLLWTIKHNIILFIEVDISNLACVHSKLYNIKTEEIKLKGAMLAIGVRQYLWK